MESGLRYMARRGLAEEAVQADKSKNVKRVVHSFRKQAKDTLNMCNTVMLLSLIHISEPTRRTD